MSSTARSSKGFAFDPAVDRTQHDRRSRGRPGDRAERSGHCAPWHRDSRAPASAAGRHPRQQGGANPGEDVLRFGVRHGPLQFPRRRPVGRHLRRRRRRSCRCAGGASLRAGALRLERKPVADRPRRLFVRRVRADEGRASGGRATPSARRTRRAAFHHHDGSRRHHRHHGEVDDVVPLGEVLAWARPLELPVVVFPGCGHFFHGRLLHLQRAIAGMWHDHAVAPGA